MSASSAQALAERKNRQVGKRQNIQYQSKKIQRYLEFKNSDFVYHAFKQKTLCAEPVVMQAGSLASAPLAHTLWFPPLGSGCTLCVP